QVDHLRPREHLHRAVADLPAKRLVRPEQELLAGLAAAVEGAGHLRPAEAAVLQQAAVLPGERHPLGDALVDDVQADLGEPVDVRLPGPEVAPLEGVVEEPPDRVAVVLVVFGGVDPPLGGDRVRPPRRVLEAERQHLVAELRQGRGGGRPGEAGADHDHRVLPLVGRVDQLLVPLVGGPLVGQRAGRDLRVELHLTYPSHTASTMAALPTRTVTATAYPSHRAARLNRRPTSPSVCRLLWTPCDRWTAITACATRYRAAIHGVVNPATIIAYTSCRPLSSVRLR